MPPGKKARVRRRRSSYTVVLFARIPMPPGWKPGSTSAEDGRRYSQQTGSDALHQVFEARRPAAAELSR
jgi:hypothetical protein